MTENIPETKLGLTHEAISHVEKISKWTFFLSILGFIYTGILVLFAFVAGSILSSLGQESEMQAIPSFFIGMLYLLIAVVYFFPVYFLYRFSVYVKQSVRDSNPIELTNALDYLRKHYLYIGILAIIAICLIPIGIAIAVLMAVLAGHSG